MHSSIALLAAGIVSAAAKTIIIDVGEGGLVYSPDSNTADVGDILEFHFFGSTHTVVQGDFGSPCQASSGFESGPIQNKADGSGSVFQVTVQNTDPIWFFCGTPSHCQNGMAGVINPPSSGDSLASYKSAAAGTSSSTSSGTLQGGVVVPVPVAGSSSTPVSSSTPPATSAASSAQSSSVPSDSGSPSAAASGSVASTGSSPSTASAAGSPPAASSTDASSASTPGSVSNSTVTNTSPTLALTNAGATLTDNSEQSTMKIVMLGLGFVIALLV